MDIYLSDNYHYANWDVLERKLDKPRKVIYQRAFYLGLTQKGYNHRMAELRMGRRRKIKKHKMVEVKKPKVQKPAKQVVPKTKLRRFADRVVKAPQRAIRIDHRTIIYVDPNLNEKQLSKILQKYKPLSK